MASTVLNDAQIFLAGHNFSGQSNAVAVEYAADAKDGTTFGNDTRINAAGLKSAVGNFSGFWDSSDTTAVDPVVFARIGTADLPLVIAQDGAVGDVAYLKRVMLGEYGMDGQIGELLPFSVTFEGTDGHPLVRGKLFHNASATGNVTGTAIQLGAVSSTQHVYAALHVFSGSGSFDVLVQSSADQAFTVPTTRITFTNVATGTAVASEWATRVAGAITDQWWRITATNPATRNFAVAVGIR